ncbi:MAG: recombinase family protein [Ruminococcus sp.]|nr:recombinase family protein [Ruminococcus sp.]
MIDLRKTAIYSRKSKFTGKGESIESQIDICKSHIKNHFPDVKEDDILTYEDEGFSGKNTNRPQFQKMLKECRQNNICRIVCYKLDRISRSISDFIKLTEELKLHNVDFVSINDNFDTHTSTGRAMLTMTMVFAQLERETIAERVRDNMLHLAKDGRWLGGNTPIGYRSSDTVGSTTLDGKTRRAKKLEIVEEEARIVKLIYSKFLEYKSLTKTETYMIQHDILTKRGKLFTRFALKSVLQNPVYLIADEQAWNYFSVADVEVYSNKDKFDGIHGIMAYNKTNQQSGKANVLNDIKEWIIAVGKHKGIIKGKDWVEVQKLLNQKKSKSYRKPKSSVALLSGLLICKECGSFMRPKLSQRRNKDGDLIYDYLCELKEKSKRQKCDMKRPNGNELDRLVCEEIKKITSDDSDFIKHLKRGLRNMDYNTESYQENLKELQKTKNKYENQIKNLVESLTQSKDSAATSYILNQINEIDSQIKAIEKQINEYLELANSNTTSEQDFEILAEMLSNTANSIDDMTVEQKRNALRSIIHKIVWDGENAHIYFFGESDSEIDLSNEEDSEAAAIGLQTRYL